MNLPITIAFAYDANQIDGPDDNAATLWTFSEEGDERLALEDIYRDAENNVVTGLASELAYFFMTIESPTITSPPPKPELIAPYDTMDDNRLSVTFRWEASELDDYYHIQVTEDEAFTSLIYDEPGLSTNIMGLSDLNTYTTYYWHVQPRNDFGEGEWSDTWTFSTNDGSGTGTIEGTWEYSHGIEKEAGAGELDWISNQSWGNLMVSFGVGTFDIAGVENNHEIYYHGSGESTEIAYTISIDAKGTYQVTGYEIEVEPSYYHRFCL